MSFRTFFERLGVARTDSEAQAESKIEKAGQAPSCREHRHVYADGQCIDNPASRPPPPSHSWITG